MARVTFSDHLLVHTGGQRELDLFAENVRELVDRLEARWPGIEEPLLKSAIAIDGQIYQDAYLEAIGAASDVFFLPRIEGG